jgi:hypothetical protein
MRIIRRGITSIMSRVVNCRSRISAYRDHLARQDAMAFDDSQQAFFIAFAGDICGRRKWRLHCVGTDETHVHVVVSWKGIEGDNVAYAELAKDRIKNLLSLLLNRHEEKSGRRVFSKKSGDRQVRTRRHLDFLKTDYLPKHSGRFWFEG